MVAHLSPGYWQACFGASLLDLIMFDAAHENRITSHRFGHVHKEAGADSIYAARNRIAQIMLDESEAEWCFLIDSDMGFAPDTVEQLVTSADPEERPVMGGLAFAQKSAGVGPMFARRYRGVPTVYAMAKDGKEVGFLPMVDYPRDSIVKCAGTGAACLLVHRSAFETVREEYGDQWFSHVPKKDVEAGQFDHYGEDLSFCLRLAAVGIPIHVDTAVKTTHDKGGVFFDEETFDIQEGFRSWLET